MTSHTKNLTWKYKENPFCSLCKKPQHTTDIRDNFLARFYFFPFRTQDFSVRQYIVRTMYTRGRRVSAEYATFCSVLFTQLAYYLLFRKKPITHKKLSKIGSAAWEKNIYKEEFDIYSKTCNVFKIGTYLRRHKIFSLIWIGNQICSNISPCWPALSSPAYPPSCDRNLGFSRNDSKFYPTTSFYCLQIAFGILLLMTFSAFKRRPVVVVSLCSGNSFR